MFCEGKTLENLFLFKYLGSLFSANGEQSHDVDSRITKAKNRCVAFGKIFDCKKLSTELKVRLYVAAVCSLLTYGSETWDLSDKTRSKLNNANSIMLARVTGHSFREEARPTTTSFDLVLSV